MMGKHDRVSILVPEASPSDDLATIVESLLDAGCEPRLVGGGWMARCPDCKTPDTIFVAVREVKGIQ